MLRRAGVLAVLALALAPAPAHAAGVTSWSLYSEPRDFIGQGVQRVMHPGNVQAPIEATCCGWHDSPGAWVRAADGESFGLDFSPPAGEPLAPYNRVGVQRHPFNEDGHAGMEVFGSNRGCNGILGRYELRDLAVDAAGKPTRLWLVYEALCDHRYDGSFGEIRINANVPEVQQQVAPGILRFPELDLWQQSIEVPVSYLGSAPITSVAVVGAAAGDFPLDASGCQGSTGPCDVRLRFAPTAGGARTATLRFTDATGRAHETTLEGYAHGGTTVADIELVREGRTFHYTPDSATFGATAWRYEVEAALNDPTDFGFGITFGSAAQPLAPGHFPDAVSGPGSPNPWLSVSWDNWTCESGGGEFTLHELRRMHDQTMRSFDVEFMMVCDDDGQPVVRGRWKFRAGADPALPDWLVPGPRAVPAEPDEPDDAPLDNADEDWEDWDDEEEGGPQRSPTQPHVRVRWLSGKRFTRVGRLVVTGLANEATVRLRCKGPHCPFRVVKVRAHNGRADLGRKLAAVRLRPGTVLELRAGGEVFRYAIRRGKPPRARRAR